MKSGGESGEWGNVVTWLLIIEGRRDVVQRFQGSIGKGQPSKRKTDRKNSTFPPSTGPPKKVGRSTQNTMPA